MTEKAKFVLSQQIDNPRTSVNHLYFPAGSETAWHRHERDYVIVPMQDAELVMESGEGQRRVNLKAGECYFREAGVEHNVRNLNDFAVTLIEIEIK